MITVVDAPAKKAGKNEEMYQEVATAFEALEIGKALSLPSDQYPVQGIKQNLKKHVTLKQGEELRFSATHGSDKKVNGLLVIKKAAKA